jgi:hypothetical protein
MAPLRLVDPKRGYAVHWCDGRHYARKLCPRHIRMPTRTALASRNSSPSLAALACACCGREWGGRRDRQAVIDHNDTTGKVRGVICSAGNIDIGDFDNTRPTGPRRGVPPPGPAVGSDSAHRPYANARAVCRIWVVSVSRSLRRPGRRLSCCRSWK